jgi:hypothetical protein
MAQGRCSQFIYDLIFAAFCPVHGREKVFAINQAEGFGTLRLITPHVQMWKTAGIRLSRPGYRQSFRVGVGAVGTLGLWALA